ncbi:MAG: response regulator [Candidatus Thorarchaeota archaeon]
MVRTKVILLVEDNEDDVILTQRALKKANILNEIVVVGDGLEALQFLRGEGQYKDRATEALPVVILLDLNMPRMNGLEFLRELRSDESLRLLPVVVLTSSAEEQDVLKSYDLGANSFVRKPVDFNQFVDSVRTLGLFWVLLNIAPTGGT